MKIQTREGLRRLLLEADKTYENFGWFIKHKLSSDTFYKWQRINHSLWRIYWKITFKKRRNKQRRIGYF